jgi:hypothetical protein
VRYICVQANEAQTSQGEQPTALNEAIDLLRRGFSSTLQDRQSSFTLSKKQGSLPALNQLMKMAIKVCLFLIANFQQKNKNKEKMSPCQICYFGCND